MTLFRCRILPRKREQILLFRGAYYYTSSERKPFDPEFNLIASKFFGVPMHIDSAAYYRTDFYSSDFVIIFSKVKA